MDCSPRSQERASRLPSMVGSRRLRRRRMSAVLSGVTTPGLSLRSWASRMLLK